MEVSHEKVNALIQLQFACRLAVDALPDVPASTAAALDAPVQALCDITERELDRHHPAWRETTGPSASG
jgi:hypothetical protein